MNTGVIGIHISRALKLVSLWFASPRKEQIQQHASLRHFPSSTLETTQVLESCIGFSNHKKVLGHVCVEREEEDNEGDELLSYHCGKPYVKIWELSEQIDQVSKAFFRSQLCRIRRNTFILPVHNQYQRVYNFENVRFFSSLLF